MERARISLLTVCGLEELDGHSARRVTHVLSILDPDWPDPESFGRWDPHRRLTLRFHDIIEPIPGQILPERAHVERIIAFADELAADAHERDDGHLLVHCHMGISRSTAAMTMLLALAYPDEDEESLIARLTAIRPQAWPNLRMIGFADEILGRRGRLAAEVSRLHARQIAARPQLADTFRRLGRAREVEAALAAAA
ncbi:tyrosine phosphatase family protein [Enterovirga aerilata]|uniref:Protein-tyrosine-phosphatase n=1 Tax=Enterovirga aerilata TaxID=2730920 RepID=A0A849IEE8_9HYPH|nr:protein-tyrosine-phosphatase [Enterovirga sp. DB1703]NNM74829.1 protein-tyrosine-phosphatase [Enterovirga sp. DB1703]